MSVRDLPRVAARQKTTGDSVCKCCNASASDSPVVPPQ